MKDDLHDLSGSTSRGPDDPLDSLKEIAAYLRLDTRTVLRWRKIGGLPVNSHPDVRRGSVYAFESEIDAWWDRQRRHGTPEESPRRSGQAALWRGLPMLAVVVALAGGVSVGMYLSSGDSRTAAPATFEEQDWVLVTAFENRTREPVFDGTIEAALERELSNSRFVYVVPRARVHATLQLMERRPESRLDRVLGREVALRDGSALISGHVEKFGSVYVLSAQVPEPVAQCW